MVSRIVFHPAAAEELEEAIDWYEEQQIDLGRQFFDEYLALRDQIERIPNILLLLSRTSVVQIFSVFLTSSSSPKKKTLFLFTESCIKKEIRKHGKRESRKIRKRP